MVDCGDGVTHIVAVADSYVLPHLTRRLNVAGRDVTRYLIKLLLLRGYAFCVATIASRRGLLADVTPLLVSSRQVRLQPHGGLPDGAGDQGEVLLLLVSRGRAAPPVSALPR